MKKTLNLEKAVVGDLVLPLRSFVLKVFASFLLDEPEPLHHALRLTHDNIVHPQEVLDILCALLELQ